MTYRNLTPIEVLKLEHAGCSASSWQDILVASDFADFEIQNVRFSGKTYLNNHVTLRNISNLGSTGRTSFANGTEIGVLREDGGLEVIMHDNLSSMEAAFCVQEATAHPELVKMLKDKAMAYAGSIASDGNIIEEGAVVTDCLQLTNVHVGAYAQIIGATRLEEVSLNSAKRAESSIGPNVILDHVIISTGSHVTDGAQMDYCFVGQGCHIGRMFSATQSLFFANCHFENGEACAYFAGPYSVSHHKATLMIACMTSFFNAGSGSNQSNHSYKIGPNKYGQLLRGAKLGSCSYVYWPMQIGVFSTVIMHHTGHQDLRDLPFCLITEGHDGETHLMPGQAFRSVGTRRDVNKWPKRDKRAEGAENRRDLLNFTMLNPYTVGYILKGLEVLKELKAQGKTDYKGCLLSAHHITRGIQIYEQALCMYKAQLLHNAEGLFNAEGLSNLLTPSVSEGLSNAEGLWADYGGLLLPKEELYKALAAGKDFADLEALVPQWELNWAAAHFDLSNKEQLIAEGEEAEKQWNELLDADGNRDLVACNIDL